MHEPRTASAIMLAETTAHATRLQAALWKLEKMSAWEKFWYGRSVVREALRIGDYQP